MRLISVVVPCHNEEKALPHLVSAVSEVAASMADDFELVLVDDGSSDGTLGVMERVAAGDGGATGGDAIEHDPSLRTRWVSFSRNFGKEAAMCAGLERAAGDLVCFMDADLQDPPSLIPRMVAMLDADEDLDAVAARRRTRDGEPVMRSWLSRRFYSVMNRMSDVEIGDGARDFRMMRRPVVDAVLSLPERNRFTKGMLAWCGFNVAWVSYDNVERVAGDTNWSTAQLVRYAIDGITSFSERPLSVISGMGVMMSAIGFMALLFVVVRALAFGDPVSGWPSLVSIILFIGGVQMLAIGVIGKYVANTYVETKRRPIYVIRRESGR